MPIKAKNAPLESFEALKNGLKDFHHEEVVADTNGDQHHYTPHKVFIVDVLDLAKGKGLSNATQVGWRYIIKDANGHAQVVEIGMDEALDAHALNHINMGSHVNNFITTCKQLEAHPDVKEKHYEVNVLRIPSIYVMAIWLMGEDHDHEFFVPLAPVHQNFEAGKTYSADDFETLLKETALEMVDIKEEVSKEEITEKEEPISPPEAVEQKAALTDILGISPSVTSLLESGGVTQVEHLLEIDTDALVELLVSKWGDFNPEVIRIWQEQANLILHEQYEDLRHLQQNLIADGLLDYLRNIGMHE